MKKIPIQLRPSTVETTEVDGLLTQDQLFLKYQNASRKQLVRAQLNEINIRRGGDRILAEGDSWFDFPLPVFHTRGNDVLSSLQINFKYVIEGDLSKGGDLIRNMSTSSNLKIIDAKLRSIRPKAFILSGGGNDLVTPNDGNPSFLEDMINPKGSRNLIDRRKLISFIKAIRQSFELIAEVSIKNKTPLVIHNYAYPLVTGIRAVGFWKWGVGPWLWPAFERKNYNKNSEEANAAMKIIVDAITEMMSEIARDRKYRGWIRVVLSQSEIKPKHWHDEFHLTPEGWYLVANNFNGAIQHQGRSLAIYGAVG